MKSIAVRVGALGMTLLAASFAHGAIIVYDASLSGAVSSGTGSATVTIDTNLNTMQVQVSFTGLTGATTAAHIHCCTELPDTGNAGVATQVPTFVSFPLGVSSGTYDHLFDLTQSSSWNAAFITANGGTAASAENALLAGLAADKAYLNIHTNSFPAGEIRGFLQQVPEPATLALLSLGLAGLGVARRRKAQ